MPEQNPYLTPEAPLETSQKQFYQPKVFAFNGRIGRLRYLAYGIGVNLVLMLLLMPIMGGTMAFANTGGQSAIGMLAMAAFYIATFIFSVMFGKRRLNDLNRSGWWFLLLFVPIVNLLMTIYLIFFPGTDEINDFGPVPVENSLGVKALAFLLPIFIIGILAAIAIPAYQGYVIRAQQSQMQ